MHVGGGVLLGAERRIVEALALSLAPDLAGGDGNAGIPGSATTPWTSRHILSKQRPRITASSIAMTAPWASIGKRGMAGVAEQVSADRPLRQRDRPHQRPFE